MTRKDQNKTVTTLGSIASGVGTVAGIGTAVYYKYPQLFLKNSDTKGQELSTIIDLDKRDIEPLQKLDISSNNIDDLKKQYEKLVKQIRKIEEQSSSGTGNLIETYDQYLEKYKKMEADLLKTIKEIKEIEPTWKTPSQDDSIINKLISPSSQSIIKPIEPIEPIKSKTPIESEKPISIDQYYVNSREEYKRDIMDMDKIDYDNSSDRLLELSDFERGSNLKGEPLQISRLTDEIEKETDPFKKEELKKIKTELIKRYKEEESKDPIITPGIIDQSSDTFKYIPDQLTKDFKTASKETYTIVNPHMGARVKTRKLEIPSKYFIEDDSSPVSKTQTKFKKELTKYNSSIDSNSSDVTYATKNEKKIKEKIESYKGLEKEITDLVNERTQIQREIDQEINKPKSIGFTSIYESVFSSKKVEDKLQQKLKDIETELRGLTQRFEKNKIVRKYIELDKKIDLSPIEKKQKQILKHLISQNKDEELSLKQQEKIINDLDSDNSKLIVDWDNRIDTNKKLFDTNTYSKIDDVLRSPTYTSDQIASQLFDENKQAVFNSHGITVTSLPPSIDTLAKRQKMSTDYQRIMKSIMDNPDIISTNEELVANMNKSVGEIIR